MRIGAYQFPVTGNITENMSHILDAVSRASREGVELLVFPECAVTGYPPLALPSPADIDEERKNEAHTQLQKAAIQNRMHLIAGTIIRRGSSFYNAALCFAPDGTVTEYDKRALWGWDQENFTPGTRDGILQAGTLKIGIRICFEVRFPEYFRELYRAKTDLNVILFSDTAAQVQDGSVYYGTQVLASSKLMKESDSYFKGYKVRTVKSGNLYKYIVGFSEDLNQAKKENSDIKKVFKDSFMVKVEGNTASML